MKDSGYTCVNFKKRFAHYEFTREPAVFHLGIEFYLLVSHGGMNDRGSTCKFRNARSAFRNLHMDPLSFIPP